MYPQTQHGYTPVFPPPGLTTSTPHLSRLHIDETARRAPIRRRASGSLPAPQAPPPPQQPLVQEFQIQGAYTALELYLFGNPSTGQLAYCDPEVERAYGVTFKGQSYTLAKFSKSKFVCKRLLYTIHSLPAEADANNLARYVSGDHDEAARKNLFLAALAQVLLCLGKKQDSSVVVSTLYGWMIKDDFYKNSHPFDIVRFESVL